MATAVSEQLPITAALIAKPLDALRLKMKLLPFFNVFGNLSDEIDWAFLTGVITGSAGNGLVGVVVVGGATATATEQAAAEVDPMPAVVNPVGQSIAAVAPVVAT